MDKGSIDKKPSLAIGQVESVSVPQPRISMGYPYMNNGTDMTIDLKVKVGNDSLGFQKVPTNISTASFGNVVICDNREDTLTAVDNFYQNSKRILGETAYHESVMEACDEMFTTLNPAYAKDKERDNDIATLKGEVSEVRGEINNMRSDFRGAVSEIKSLLSMYMPSPGAKK